MRKLKNFSIVATRLAHCLLATLLYFTHISSGCIPRQQGGSLLERQSTATSTEPPPPSPPPILANSTEISPTNVTEKYLLEESRKKRQLFREDIPKHRPLSGNHYARIHGFPLPGRFNENPNNNIAQDGGTTGVSGPAFGYVPVTGGEPGLIYEPELEDVYKHVGYGGNEIVHQYPVEVSQVIQLGHGLKSRPVKVHPDQNLEHHPLKHHVKPHEPVDLVVHEPVGSPLYGHRPGGVYANHGPPAGYHYGGPHHHHHHRPPPPVPLFYKFPNIFKSWPIIFHKIWPFRRYPVRVKHQQHLHHHYA